MRFSVFIEEISLKINSFFYFLFFIRKSANTVERLDDSGENSAERRNVLSGPGERTQMCRMAQWAAERLLSSGRSLFQGKYWKSVLLFLPWDTVLELSLSDDWHSFSARPSGLGVDDTVKFSVWSRTDKLSFGRSEPHRALLLCHWPDTIIFPHIRTNQRLAVNLHFYNTFLEASPFSFFQS